MRRPNCWLRERRQAATHVSNPRKSLRQPAWFGLGCDAARAARLSDSARPVSPVLWNAYTKVFHSQTSGRPGAIAPRMTRGPLAKGSKDRARTCLRRPDRIGVGAGARRDLPKTHRSRARQITSRRRPRTTANDGRAASRALGRSVWRGDGGHFSSLEAIPLLPPSFVVDGSSVPALTIARFRNRNLLGEFNIDAFLTRGELRLRQITELSGVSRFRSFIGVPLRGIERVSKADASQRE